MSVSELDRNVWDESNMRTCFTGVVIATSDSDIPSLKMKLGDGNA